LLQWTSSHSGPIIQWMFHAGRNVTRTFRGWTFRQGTLPGPPFQRETRTKTAVSPSGLRTVMGIIEKKKNDVRLHMFFHISPDTNPWMVASGPSEYKNVHRQWGVEPS
jgi:hypothetical protein